MRIRSTKPEFWRSARIASVDWDARLVLKGLESYVDDNGVGRDDLALIVSDVFPRDLIREPSRTLARVSASISVLFEAGLVWRYVTEDTPVLYLSFWESVQRVDRPGKGRFRRPDGTLEYGGSEIRESVASPRESTAPGAVEQGNRGTEEQGLKTPSPRAASEHARFADFYRAYPRKMARPRAAKAFAKAVKRAQPDVIIAGAARYAADPNLPDRQFLPYPEKWLNGDGWNNEPCPPPPIDRRPTKPTPTQKAMGTLEMGREIQVAADRANGATNGHAYQRLELPQ